MKTLPKYPLLLVVSLILIYSAGFSQNIVDSNTVDIKHIAKQIIKNAGTCALITLDSEGTPRARAMDPFPVEDNFEIWFGTNPNSRKVDQIKNDPRVTLYYLDNDASGYVVISGIATLVDDQKQKNKYWKDEWNSFYPDKSHSYLLIKVTPLWLEVLSPPNNIYNDTLTWEPPVYLFK